MTDVESGAGAPRWEEGGNRALARVASLVDAAAQGPASLSDLSRRSGLSISTTHRWATAMVDYGFLRRNEAGVFRLGQRFLQTALEKVALPLVTELRDRTGESVQVWVRRGPERVCVVAADSPHTLRVILGVGERIPLPEGSSGRVLAADQATLESLNTHGWVESRESRVPGLGSVSAPIYADGEVIAAVGLALPLTRVTSSPGQDYGEAVVEVARKISLDLNKLGE